MSDYPREIEAEDRQRTMEKILTNDVAEVDRIEKDVASVLEEMEWPADEVYQVSMVAREIVANAIIHGNLELQSPKNHLVGWEEIIAEEARDPIKKDRRVFFKGKVTSKKVEIEVQDQSKNKVEFWKHIPDPTTGENRTNASGRGTLLSNSWMNEVEHSLTEQGTLVRLVRDLNIDLPLKKSE